jgi:WD40 repeat protein
MPVMRLIPARSTIRTVLGAMAILTLVPSAARSEAPARPDAAVDERSDPPQTDIAKPSLPPRALLRIGSDDLRTRTWVKNVAFSPDGRLIAAAQANTPTARATIFDVRTGGAVKVLVGPAGRGGQVKCVAFSPDGTKLIWGQSGGQVALWDLTADRMLFREKLHEGEVAAVGFSPDGRLMASGGGETVCLRRAEVPSEVVREFTTRLVPRPGEHLAALPAAPSPIDRNDVRCLAFSADGTRIVVGRTTGRALFVWRVSNGQLLRMIPDAHGQPRDFNATIASVAFLPDGRRIMSAGQATMAAEQRRGRFGTRSMSTTEVRIWDADTGEPLESLGRDEPGSGAAALSPDGRSVAIGDSNAIRLVDADTGRLKRRLPTMSIADTIRIPVFSQDGRLIACPLMNGIAIFEAQSGRRLHYDDGRHAGGIGMARWSPAGDRIVTGHDDGFVRAWDASTAKLLWIKPLAPAAVPSGLHGAPGIAAFSGDGSRLIAAADRDNTEADRDIVVAVYDAQTGGLLREIVRRGALRHAALTNDGRMIVIGTTQGSNHDTHFQGIERETGLTRWSSPPKEQTDGYALVAAMHFRPGSALLDLALMDGQVIRLNSLTGREVRKFLADWRSPEQRNAGRPIEPRMWNATFSADGRTLVSSLLQWIYIWDIEGGTLRRKILHPHRHHCQLALSPDGKTVATSDVWYGGDYGEDTIRLFDTETGEPVLTLETRDDRADVMVFSPDGKRLFAGMGRGSAIVWDVRRGDRGNSPK